MAVYLGKYPLVESQTQLRYENTRLFSYETAVCISSAIFVLNKKLVRYPSRRCLPTRPRDFKKAKKKPPTSRAGTKVDILHPLFKGRDKKNERPNKVLNRTRVSIPSTLSHFEKK